MWALFVLVIWINANGQPQELRGVHPEQFNTAAECHAAAAEAYEPTDPRIRAINTACVFQEPPGVPA